MTISEFVSYLSETRVLYEGKIDKYKKRGLGIFNTNFVISEYLITEIFQFHNITKDSITNLTFFEPCVGLGSFVFSYLLKAYQVLEDKSAIIQIVKNIYVADADSVALKMYQDLLTTLCKEVFQIDLEEDYHLNHSSNKLLYSLDEDKLIYTGISEIFSGHFTNGFDIVMTNPPYKNLKAELNKYTDRDTYEKDKDFYNKISLHAKSIFKYSTEGILNFYKLFVEEVLINYSKPSGIVSVLIPSTILTDKTCKLLRSLVFDNNKVISINNIPENNPWFEGTQAICSILIQKGEKSFQFRVSQSFKPPKSVSYKDVNYQTNLEFPNENSVLSLSKVEETIFEQIKKFKPLKELTFVTNKRGELDLTIHKDYITSNESPYQLLRGRDLGLYQLQNNKYDYVSPEFVDKTSKKLYINSERIACQQVANLGKDRRITFSYIPKNYVLGNSCNFIYCQENEYQIDCYYLLALFNSSIINWYFKHISSNNHVNNYELDLFPIPIPPIESVKKISLCCQSIMDDYDSQKIKQLDDLVCNLFGLNIKDLEKKTTNTFSPYLINLLKKDLSYFYQAKDLKDVNVENLLTSKLNFDSIKLVIPSLLDPFLNKCVLYIIDKYQRISKGEVLNHTSFKLSNLDLEMIEAVPQGGNWTNISKETITKSKRLTRLTQTGGRTTLYGRIDYEKPCYTITTYFNRPGNGTYVHPIHNRVISVREAARIQSFDDSYYFVGTKTSILKQVGNAVPPLFAMEIAKNIASKIDIKTSLDLFVGAGGLSAGLEKAGIRSIVGVDYDRSACLTLKVNYPSINVICGDLTLKSTKDKIYQGLGDEKVDMICGGPPCQGFSLAGKRLIDDPRNRLFLEYLEILEEIKPKLFILENVEGMKSMQDGLIYQEITKEFESKGYKVEGMLLFADKYGVPQKRKRLITIGVRSDIPISPSELFPIPLNTKVTARDAIEDLQNIECSENSFYNSDKISKYVRKLKNSKLFSVS